MLSKNTSMTFAEKLGERSLVQRSLNARETPRGGDGGEAGS
jgi:hypothetical protein